MNSSAYYQQPANYGQNNAHNTGGYETSNSYSQPSYSEPMYFQPSQHYSAPTNNAQAINSPGATAFNGNPYFTDSFNNTYNDYSTLTNNYSYTFPAQAPYSEEPSDYAQQPPSYPTYQQPEPSPSYPNYPSYPQEEASYLPQPPVSYSPPEHVPPPAYPQAPQVFVINVPQKPECPPPMPAPCDGKKKDNSFFMLMLLVVISKLVGKGHSQPPCEPPPSEPVEEPPVDDCNVCEEPETDPIPEEECNACEEEPAPEEPPVDDCNVCDTPHSEEETYQAHEDDESIAYGDDARRADEETESE